MDGSGNEWYEMCFAVSASENSYLKTSISTEAVVSAIGNKNVHIIYHHWVKKLNKYNQVQKRLLVLSDYHLYTLKSHHNRFTVSIVFSKISWTIVIIAILLYIQFSYGIVCQCSWFLGIGSALAGCALVECVVRRTSFYSRAFSKGIRYRRLAVIWRHSVF